VPASAHMKQHAALAPKPQRRGGKKKKKKKKR
jgi:hypothetical protein